MMTFAQVVETSVNVTNNSPSRDYSHPDDQTTQITTFGISVVCNLFVCFFNELLVNLNVQFSIIFDTNCNCSKIGKENCEVCHVKLDESTP